MVKHDLLHLDVNKLHRAGALQKGNAVEWCWEDDATIGIAGGGRAFVLLAYDHGSGQVVERISLGWTPCNYGGERPWFRCPSCHRRAGKLYGPRFQCRHCSRFVYASTREPRELRMIRRSEKIRARLGLSPVCSERFPTKPKGMHWRTYWRLRESERDAYLGSLQAVVARFGG